MQARRRFVEQVKRAFFFAFGKFEREFEALCFTAGKCRRGLSEFQVAEPDFVERAQQIVNARLGAEECAGIGDRHVEHFGDVYAFEKHFERFAVVARAAAARALDPGFAEKLHVEGNLAFALAFFATSAALVKRKSSGVVAAHFSERRGGVEFSQQIENARERRRVRARGTPDRGLVDTDETFKVFQSVDACVLAGNALGAVDFARGGVPEDAVDERGFARAGNAANDGQRTDRKRDVEVFQIVFGGSAYGEKLFGLNARECCRNFTETLLRRRLKQFRRAGISVREAFRKRAGKHEGTSLSSRSGTDFDDVISGKNRVAVVFDDEHAVSAVTQILHLRDEARVVGGV